MKRLITADVHFTSHYSLSPKRGKISMRLTDSIRCIVWLYQQAIAENCDEIWVVGDMLQLSTRVNFEDLITLKKLLEASPVPVKIIGGNHDITNNAWVIELYDTAIVEPSLDDNVYAIPYGYQPISRGEINLWHGTVKGAVLTWKYRTEEGVELPDGLWLLGHVHLPQTLSERVHYIGPPYRIRFGDEVFDPRVCIVDGATVRWVTTHLPPQFVQLTSPITQPVNVKDAYVKLDGENWEQLQQDKAELLANGARAVLITQRSKVKEVSTNVADPLQIIRELIESDPPQDKQVYRRVMELLDRYEEE